MDSVTAGSSDTLVTTLVPWARARGVCVCVRGGRDSGTGGRDSGTGVH